MDEKEINHDEKIKMLDIGPQPYFKEFVQKNYPNIEYKSNDISREADYSLNIMDMKEISDGEYDFFLCSHVLEHVSDDKKALRELYRILKAGGRGILMVPIDLELKEIDENPGCTDVKERWRRFGDGDHVRSYSKQGFLERVRGAGFSIREYDKNYFGEKIMRENAFCDTVVVYVVQKVR